MGKVYDWFEERLEIQAIADDITSKYVPPHVNIFYCIGGITFTLTPSQSVDSLILLNVNASSVRVVMNDSISGVVYDQTIVLYGNEGITDYYSYFFNTIADKKTTAAFLDMPRYPTATITVTISSGSALAEVGEVVYGMKTIVGRTNYNTAIGIKSFSRKEVDEFGNVTVIKRRNSKYCEYDIDIDNYKLNEINNEKFFNLNSFSLAFCLQ